jgi:hypothetical protein
LAGRPKVCRNITGENDRLSELKIAGGNMLVRVLGSFLVFASYPFGGLDNKFMGIKYVLHKKGLQLSAVICFRLPIFSKLVHTRFNNTKSGL